MEAEAVLLDDDSSVDVVADADVAMGVEDDAEDDADDAATSRPALGPSDWHSARCAKSQNLVDPADDDEKSTWDNDHLPLRMQPGKDCHDLEDVDRHYKVKLIILPAAGYNKETGQCDNQAGFLQRCEGFLPIS